MPKISIVMGIYNCEETLGESIDSMLHQTYTDWELVMCDDGSTDNTLSFAMDYAKHDSRIRVIRNTTNKGLAYSLNKGIKESKGEYIARMDADDISKFNRLEMQIAYMEQHPEVAVLGTNTLYFDENGIWGESKNKNEIKETDIVRKPPFAHPTVLMRKKSLLAVGGYTVNKWTYRAEDYDLWCKFWVNGYKLALLEEPLVQVRLNMNAYKRRKYKYRIDEYQLKRYWYKKLKVPFKYYIYVVKPLIVGLIPSRLMESYHKHIYSKGGNISG